MKAEPTDRGPMGAEGGPGAFQRGPAYRSLRSSMALFPRKDGAARQVSRHRLVRRLECFSMSPVFFCLRFILGMSTKVATEANTCTSLYKSVKKVINMVIWPSVAICV